MKEFTKLNIACLKDMQMLLDAIADTTFKIDNILLEERNKISRYIKENLPANFNIGEWEQEVDILSQDETEERLLMPNLDITYSTTIYLVDKKEDVQYFDLFIGYLSDSRQNVIYVHLFNSVDNIILTESFISECKTNISKEWICDSDNTMEEPNIYIEFSIDDNFTLEKVEMCFCTCKKHILQPIIDKLQ